MHVAEVCSGRALAHLRSFHLNCDARVSIKLSEILRYCLRVHALLLVRIHGVVVRQVPRYHCARCKQQQTRSSRLRRDA
jgi:hypothetical protein